MREFITWNGLIMQNIKIVFDGFDGGVDLVRH